MDPIKFWDYTFYEVECILESKRKDDELEWNHTASLMSLYANSKSKKKFSPNDFHLYRTLEKEDAKPKSTEEVMTIAEKMKNFKNGW